MVFGIFHIEPEEVLISSKIQKVLPTTTPFYNKSKETL